MKRLLLLFISIILFCSASFPQKNQKEEAIDIAITDFLKSKLSKRSNVFRVSIYEKDHYDGYEINEDLLVISIVPENTKTRIMPLYYLTFMDTIGSVRLPTRYEEKNGILFYWSDKDYGLTEETIKVFLDYYVVDLLENSEYDFLFGMERSGIPEFVKIAHYYFCKNDLNKFKSVKTILAARWYKPPKIKCKK